jgi:hypothetical protein
MPKDEPACRWETARLRSFMLHIVTFLSLFGASPASGSDAWCSDGPPYYAFELYTTRNIPGTGLARGTVDVSASGASPFAVDLGPDGSYVYDLRIALERMKPPRQGRLVAWVTTPEIDQVARMGVLDENLRGSGTVSWNKFIVVITLEPDDDPSSEMWTGPIVFRGMSRSGMMHTMVGHGALQQENCAAYGYGN